MDVDLKCNNLSCRKSLVDKAVVTTCSHIFCAECANELFTAAQLCPACETHLSEPDDVVVSSLHPSNDYKTSVLSGLAPSLVLEICGRALSFWQYQTHQEYSFQQAVLKNMNERNAQLQKQLDSVIREANGELSLMNSKLQGLEKELEMERRKIRELQDTTRERDKEYQKLKNHFDKIKRKTLLAPNTLGNDGFAVPMSAPNETHMITERAMNKGRGNMFANPGGVNAVVGGMEANGIQRTPLCSGMGGLGGHSADWQSTSRHDMAAFRAHSVSDQSADEVENILGGPRQMNRQFMPRAANNAMQYNGRMLPGQSVPGMQQSSRRVKSFRPAGPR